MRRIVLALAMASLAAPVTAASTAEAQMPRPDSNTPTLYGGQTLPSGSMSIGASTGYPSTRFQMVWGLRDGFDLGIEPALTYGRNLSGIRQDVGLDFQVPLRFVLAENSGFNVGLRVVPYFRIGEASPAFSTGGKVGARFGIPLPKIFTLFVGPELRLGFASLGQDPPGRRNGLDGAVYVVFGLESFFKDKWFFFNEWNAGGYFGSNDLNGDGLLNVWFGFGRLFR